MTLHLRERLRRAPVWLRNKLRPGAVILAYHRVTELADDPFGLALSPARFAEHLAAIRACGRPTSLAELAVALAAGRRLPRAVVVTLDDGYADNLFEAKPLLAEYEVPATVFVASGKIGATREFWWDELDRLLLGRHALPAEVTLAVADGVRRWPLGDAAAEGATPGSRAVRLQVLREMHALLRHRTPVEIDDELDRLRRTIGLAPACRASHRTMTADEVRRLADGGLVEIGAHTVSHPRLSSLTPERQADELRRDKAALETLLARPVQSVAYPFGKRSDVTLETPALADAVGFACACTTEPGVVTGDPARVHSLPRYPVPNVSGRDLEAWLRWEALG